MSDHVGDTLKAKETKPRVFDENGPVGKQFTEKGAIGGTADKIGGPLSKDGLVGKQFTTEGSIGGTAQSIAGGQKDKKT
ncbi:hypothetical protein B0I35DRAFT_477357 [Stachybotrys elegans]|uniref:Uncharacterized protein n=1 Tax=Stachybotrys elegans TaxID=80388 RepID=A0A8K0WS16_9HYPO|nr:hypothetical protein B0I35DRAFT_477357 [Stachybotrys elegans]